MRAIGSAAPAGKLSFGRVYLYSTLRPLVRSFVRSFTRKREHADTDVRVYVFVHFRFSRTFPVTALGVPPRTGMSANQSKSPNGCTMTAPELSLGLPRPPPTPALPPNPPPANHHHHPSREPRAAFPWHLPPWPNASETPERQRAVFIWPALWAHKAQELLRSPLHLAAVTAS